LRAQEGLIRVRGGEKERKAERQKKEELHPR